MARTVVPPPSSSEGERAAGGGQTDQLPEKLVKYIPAETLAFVVPLAAALGTGNNSLLTVVLIVAAIGTPAYLWNSAQSLPKNEQPLWHFYALAVIAYGCWVLGSSPAVADLVGVDEVAAGVILALGVFLIPLADGVFNRLQGRGA